MCSYVAVMAALTLRKRWDVVKPTWSAFQHEFMWSRAYLLLFYIVKASPVPAQHAAGCDAASCAS